MDAIRRICQPNSCGLIRYWVSNTRLHSADSFNPEALDEMYCEWANGSAMRSCVTASPEPPVLALQCTALQFFGRRARPRPRASVLNQTIAPRAVEETLLAEEHRRFPGSGSLRGGMGAATEATIRREKGEWDLADLIFCPSEFVREGVVRCGGSADKCVIVPYGVDDSFLMTQERRPHTGPLRVLSVGEAGLRKGVGYACEVARMLGNQAEFRWVGPIMLNGDARRRVREHVHLPGALPRIEILGQFEWADVFFLPSICARVRNRHL